MVTPCCDPLVPTYDPNMNVGELPKLWFTILSPDRGILWQGNIRPEHPKQEGYLICHLLLIALGHVLPSDEQVAGRKPWERAGSPSYCPKYHMLMFTLLAETATAG